MEVAHSQSLQVSRGHPNQRGLPARAVLMIAAHTHESALKNPNLCNPNRADMCGRARCHRCGRAGCTVHIACLERRNCKRKPTPVGFEPTRGNPIGLAGRRLNRFAARKTTLVGFEPTRGDPIGLAGRRLNCSAKVSLESWRYAQGPATRNTTPVGFEPTRGDPIGLAGGMLARAVV